jgi:uncharacterized protein
MRESVGVTIRVKATPRSARSEIVGQTADGILKVKVAAAPENGKANEELCRVLAEHYGVRKSAVTVVSGRASPLKLVRIETA